MVNEAAVFTTAVVDEVLAVPAPSSTASSAAAPAFVVNEAAPAAGLAARHRRPRPAVVLGLRLRSQQAKK